MCSNLKRVFIFSKLIIIFDHIQWVEIVCVITMITNNFNNKFLIDLNKKVLICK